MYESETTSLTKKPPRTQLPIGLMKTMGVNKYQKCEQIDSKCEQYDSTVYEPSACRHVDPGWWRRLAVLAPPGGVAADWWVVCHWRGVWDALEIAQHPSCCKTLILLQKHFIVENCVQSCTYLATQLKQLDNTTILATHLSGRVLALNFSSSPRNHPPSLLALPKHSCVQNWEHNLVQPCTTLHNLAHIAATQQFDNTTTLTTYLSGKVQVLNFFSSPPNHLPSHFGIKTLHRIYSSLHDIFSNSRIHSYLVHPLSPFPPPPVVLSPLYLVRDCGMASAARCPLVALILGACGLWFAKFVTYS